MTKQRLTLIILIVLWIGLVAASYFMSVRIDGPRNIDTGFRRLDVLFRYQLIAFAIALIAAVLGVIWRKTGERMLLMGMAPLMTTVLAFAVLWGAASLLRDRSMPDAINTPVTKVPSAPAVTAGE